MFCARNSQNGVLPTRFASMQKQANSCMVPISVRSSYLRGFCCRQAGFRRIQGQQSKDRIVEFEAKTALSTASMGDSINAPAGRQVHFTIRMIALQGAYPEIIQDGSPTSSMDKSASIKPDETPGFDYVSDGKRHWFRVNIRSAGGSLLIVGNPIYLNF